MKTLAVTTLLAVCLYATACSSAAFGQTALSNDEGRNLVHEAIKKDAASAYLEQSIDRSDGSKFLEFTAESPEGSVGSAVVGYFDVNKITGDVWEIAGVVCTQLKSEDLQRAQSASLKKRNVDRATYLKFHKVRPAICG